MSAHDHSELPLTMVRNTHKLGVEHKFLVVAEQERPGKAADIHVLDAPSFLACLPV